MDFLKHFGLQLVAFTWSGSTESVMMETVSEPVAADNDSHNSQDDDERSGSGSNNDDQMITNKIAAAAATDRNIVEDLEQRVHELDCKLRQVCKSKQPLSCPLSE